MMLTFYSNSGLLIVVAVISTVSAVAYGASTQGLRNDKDPSPPVWPNVFSIEFNETTDHGRYQGLNTAIMYYNWNIVAERTDRSSGQYDRFCGPVIAEDTPCNQYVVNGTRYLSWPQKNYCCKCCTDAGGCGVVTPTWIGDSPHAYLGQEVVSSYNVDAWDVVGNQQNYYYQTVQGGVPVQLVQQGQTVRFFSPNTFKTGSESVPPDAFELPSNCEQKCADKAPNSPCAQLP